MWLLSTTRLQKFNNSFLWRFLQTSPPKMAKSRFEYVKSFETEEKLDPRHWIVISLKVCNYEHLINIHDLHRPNDKRAIQLFEASARSVMGEFKELVLGYGFGDEFSFTFAKNTTLYKRRRPKLLTNLCSLMSSAFVWLWPLYFESISLAELPNIEGTIYLLPDDQCLRDYLTQRQFACHHRNLYNTVLWSLVNNCRFSMNDACDMLKGTSESDKNEILFTKCNMNYNKEEDEFKKGTIIVRTCTQATVSTPDGSTAQRIQSCLSKLCFDFVKDSFWRDILVLNEGTKVNPKTNYLKDLEKTVKLLPHSWIVVRIDGKGFHKFSEKHNFTKPNDIRSIKLMNKAAKKVMEEYPDIVLSYGESDEYTFVISRYSRMHNRCANKIMSSVVSIFAGTYVYHWNSVLENTPIQYSPAFDARTVLYPNNSCLRDYLSWRQADCHINNMYNTCFWVLVQEGNCSRQLAEERLRGTFSKDKRAILHEFNREYDHEDSIFRKGTIMYRDSSKGTERDSVPDVIVEHVDLIGDEFWDKRHWILGEERSVRTIDDLDY